MLGVLQEYRASGEIDTQVMLIVWNFVKVLNDDEFVFNTTTVLRVLADNMLKPSEELGRPFVEIVDSFSASGKKSMMFKTPSVEYSLEGKVIGHVNDSML